MKKLLSISFSLLVVTSITFAEANEILAEVSPTSVSGEITRNINFLKALKDRILKYLNVKEKSTVVENVFEKKAKLQETQIKARVDATPTVVEREGELTDYTGRRGTTKYQIYSPTSKLAFKKRAIDYYVNGGNAGVEAMKEGGVNMKYHKVEFIPTRSDDMRAAVGEINKENRDALRNVGYHQTEGPKIQYNNRKSGDPYLVPYYNIDLE